MAMVLAAVLAAVRELLATVVVVIERGGYVGGT